MIFARVKRMYYEIFNMHTLKKDGGLVPVLYSAIRS